jgi:hypothetical protein
MLKQAKKEERRQCCAVLWTHNLTTKRLCTNDNPLSRVLDSVFATSLEQWSLMMEEKALQRWSHEILTLHPVSVTASNLTYNLMQISVEENGTYLAELGTFCFQCGLCGKLENY